MLVTFHIFGVKTMKIRRAGLVANIRKQKTNEYIKALKNWLEERGVEVFVEKEIAAKAGIGEALNWDELASRSQVIIVLGGDGTLLRTARNVARHDIPLVGINMGSFGYLNEINLEEMQAALELILAGKYVTQKRMMLDVVIRRGEKVITAGTVLNDIVINRGNMSRIVELETAIDNKYLTTYKADGLIVSTPTGSTAYSLSAGGPIVYPENDLIILNPICPHTLTNRPIIIPEDSDLKVTLWSKEKGATLTLDGQESCKIKPGDVVNVKKSKYTTKLILSPHRSYWEILRSKLGWGGLPSGAKKRKNA
jgi:NAD+ kinase